MRGCPWESLPLSLRSSPTRNTPQVGHTPSQRCPVAPWAAHKMLWEKESFRVQDWWVNECKSDVLRPPLNDDNHCDHWATTKPRPDSSLQLPGHTLRMDTCICQMRNQGWKKLASGSHAVSGPASLIREVVAGSFKPILSPDRSAALTHRDSTENTISPPYNAEGGLQRPQLPVSRTLHLRMGLEMHWRRDVFF